MKLGRKHKYDVNDVLIHDYGIQNQKAITDFIVLDDINFTNANVK